MKITADTNIILRCLLDDDPKQTAAARELVQRAEQVAIPLAVLCEVVWTLTKGYKLASDKIADALEWLVDSDKVKTNRGAVDTGLAVLRAGGDFADGVIACEGFSLGGEVFATFDKKAASLIKKYGGIQTHLLS
jgi:predicted nucleic-acid-binding protein